MSDVSSITSAMMAMIQSQTQEQISVSMLKMDAEAQAAMADMLMQNARQVAALSHAAGGGSLDLFA